MPKAKPKTKAKVVARKKPIKVAKKKIKKAPLPKAVKVDGKLVGKISHYFSNIQVGIINLSAPLSLGDKIRIIGGEATDFNQKVTSMQIDHQEVKKAKKGDLVGFKTDQQVREGYKIYKVS